MKFKDWKLNQLIDYLKLVQCGPDADYTKTIRCSGEIHLYNGEGKDGKTNEPIDDIIKTKDC